MENKPQKFRASYTVLSMWASGRWQDAISAYFKLDTFTTRQMEAGKTLHGIWEDEIRKSRCLPVVFGGTPLGDPVPELKKVVELEPWLDLVFVIDCYDKELKDLHEFKSGIQSSQVYARDKQIGIYAVGAILSDMPVKRLFVHHYNQYTKEADTSMVWVTPKLLTSTVEWVENTSAEMHQYLINNKLYERFEKN